MDVLLVKDPSLDLQARCFKWSLDAGVSMPVFARHTNYSGDGTTSIGFCSVVNVLKYGREVGVTQGEVADPDTNGSVLSQYQRWEVLQEASVVNWCGRLHGVVQTILGEGFHFVKQKHVTFHINS